MKIRKIIPKLFNMFYWSFFAGTVFSFVTLILHPEYSVKSFVATAVCSVACVIFDTLEMRCYK